MKFYIRKSSRLPRSPYAGPSCAKAGVEPGKIYDSKEQAEADANKLNEVNPVGFVVETCDN